jgi:ion channel
MVTTVGDAGIRPTTTAGEIIAIAIMVAGIGFVAIVTAYVADRFIRSEVEAREDRVLAKLDAIEQRLERIERGV